MALGPIATPPHESYTCGDAGGRTLLNPPARLVRCEKALAAKGVSLRLKFNLTYKGIQLTVFLLWEWEKH